MKWQNDETTTKLIKTRATPLIRITLMMIMIIIFFFGLCSPLAGEPGHCPLSLSLSRCVTAARLPYVVWSDRGTSSK